VEHGLQRRPQVAQGFSPATSRRMPIVTLGWQTWSVVVVLVVALMAAVYIILL